MRFGEVTSRGAIEEFHCAIKHALHLEGHLEEMIANAARSKHNTLLHHLAEILDDVRKNRQELQKISVDLEAGGVNFTGPCTRCRADMSGLGAPQHPRRLRKRARSLF
jgi:hypothetical protein